MLHILKNIKKDPSSNSATPPHQTSRISRSSAGKKSSKNTSTYDLDERYDSYNQENKDEMQIDRLYLCL